MREGKYDWIIFFDCLIIGLVWLDGSLFQEFNLWTQHAENGIS